MQPVLKFNEPAIRELLATVARYLGIDGEFDGFYEYVGALNRSVNIPSNLTELGVKTPDIGRLARAAVNDPCAAGNPIEMTPDNTYRLIESSL